MAEDASWYLHLELKESTTRGKSVGQIYKMPLLRQPRASTQSCTHARTAGHLCVHHRAGRADLGADAGPRAAGLGVFAADGGSADLVGGKKSGARAAAHWQADRDRGGWGTFGGTAPDDCRSTALEGCAGEAGGKERSGCV